ncbi:alpha/beta hydrolase [Saccharopolyspora sp. WRP15-2]|uniref:Alpha/beta hydrolase n=1 Tax=Saccharopolyspora oryzae TaxID=2997343 RepID=A0ABT4V8E6_9PSEU|nr:alpha/beta hydrolase [Saccharopolyspora oryzae]MDA3630240.1 alpha/beta hydrolase [Saccharopolyspora oryzae]
MSFDPRDTKANAGTIRSAAGDLEAVSGSLTGHGQSVGSALRTTAKSFSDLISSRITSQAAYNESACQTAVSAVIFGQAVTDGWAEDVEWFKREREKLIKQWNEAEDSNFGVQKPELAKVPADEKQEKLSSYDSKVASAKSAKLEELNKKAADLWERFQDKAGTRGSQLTNGPTPEALHQLDAAGLLPLAATSLFGSDWTPARPHALLASLIDKGVLPAKFAEMSAAEVEKALTNPDDPKLAQALVNHGQGSMGSDPIAKELQALAKAGDAQGISKLLGGLSGEQQHWYALLLAPAIGNLSGASFDMRATSNRVRINAALGDKNADIASLKKRIEKLQGELSDTSGYNPYGGGYNLENARIAQEIQDLKKQLEAAETRSKTLEGMLTDTRTNYGHLPGEPNQVHRKIVYFDPKDDGAVAELLGNINKDTKNVGVHVPGTGTDIDNFGGVADKVEGFVREADRSGDNLAMVAWMGSDLPDSVPKDAPFVNYSEDGGKKLAGFSHELRQEMNRNVPDNDLGITVSGHSYGGAVVGKGEVHGMDANRILHIESAGMGHNVDSPDDYNNPNKHVSRYSMTAPSDAIGAIQGKNGPDWLGMGNLGHGADPDEFDGVTRLETGRYSDDPKNVPDGEKPGSVIAGPTKSHSNVFSYDSDAWWNMYNVHTGGQVEVYQEPARIDTGHGVIEREQVDLPNYEPEYEDVK